MKIKFHEPTWCLLQETTCGFTGRTKVKSIEVMPEEFEVLSIQRDKKTQSSNIHVWSDGACDGDNEWLINVPNGLYRVVEG